jgi:hypothetical protein
MADLCGAQRNPQNQDNFPWAADGFNLLVIQ